MQSYVFVFELFDHVLFDILGNIYVRTADSVNVVEGEKLRVHCIVHGNPLPEITWIVKGNIVILNVYLSQKL